MVIVLLVELGWNVRSGYAILVYNLCNYTLMAVQENERTARLNELLLRQAQSLESVHILLSTQGFISPPISPTGGTGSPSVGLGFR